ncbi:MAG: c-type cytochrome [Amphritea sp.]|nr:c-type cytochrome [Amphritea sp.]
MIYRRAVPVFVYCILSIWNSGIYAEEQASGLLPEVQKTMPVQAGKSLYAMCLGCHSPGYNRTGPKHCGVYGRLAGSQEGYQYSEALKSSSLRWNRQTLDLFLKAPTKIVPGTSMTFAGISDAGVRAQLIDYLATLAPGHKDCE